MKHALAILLIACSTAVDAQVAPEASPQPTARPDPEDREAELAVPPEVALTLEPQTGVRDLLGETDAEFEACLAALDQFGTVFTVGDQPVVEDDPDCGILRPITVEEILPGITLLPDSRMRCATARSLAEWVAGYVVPASRSLPDHGRITAIDHGSTYICRRRNNAVDGKLSEHAFGNAIDVMGFRFEDGEAIAIEPREREGTMIEAFQDAVRATACLSFTTVLGPGTDAAHANHLHLDVKQRSGGFRLCQ